MSDLHTRQFHVRAESVDVDSGTFEAAVFTSGEASDGHILSIRGGKTAKRIPLFINHEADPRSQLGSLDFARRTDTEIIYRGEVAQNLEGPDGDMRRNLVRMMADGHISRMSGRWNPIKSVRRTSLPKDHVAYVSDSGDGPQRFGMFFEKWEAMEGSVVGLGADGAATIRMLTTGEAEEPAADEPIIELAEEPQPSSEDAIERFRSAADHLINAGLKPEDLIDCLARAYDLYTEEPEVPVEVEIDEPDTEREAADEISDAVCELKDALRDFTEAVRGLRPEQPSVALPETREGDPPAAEPEAVAPAPITPEMFREVLNEMLDSHEAQVVGYAESLITRAIGKVSP